MKTLQNILLSRWGLFLLVIGIVLFVFILLVQQAQSQGDIPAYPPPPTPILTPFPSDNTATPDNTQVAESGTSLPIDKPFIVSEKIDLSPELKEEEEYYIYVKKDTGEIIFYLVGPLPPADDLSTIPQTIMDKLPLDAGDVIILWEPPSPMRRNIPTPQSLNQFPTIELTTNPAYP